MKKCLIILYLPYLVRHPAAILCIPRGRPENQHSAAVRQINRQSSLAAAILVDQYRNTRGYSSRGRLASHPDLGEYSD